MSHHTPNLSSIRNITIEEYGYELPFERIAQKPCEPREAARMLYYCGDTIEDRHFYDLPNLLPSNALLVGNNTKVLHARLEMRTPSGAAIEIFLLEPANPSSMEMALACTSGCEWKCLVGNSKRWKEGLISLDTESSPSIHAERINRLENGESIIRFVWNSPLPFAEILLEAGQIPIPPYLKRRSTQQDSEWYQTIFAQVQGSVAAPTAGLHFSQRLLEQLQAHGIAMRNVMLHVGAGTFLPVKSSTIGEHPMHSERISISLDTLQAMEKAQGSIIAIGTTSLRTIESLYWIACQIQQGRIQSSSMTVEQWSPYQTDASLTRREALRTLIEFATREHTSQIEASTSLLIAPGYRLRMADGLITNFHQPHSTLLLLVAAIVDERWRKIYSHALERGYQFLSYGDGMLLIPQQL